MRYSLTFLAIWGFYRLLYEVHCDKSRRTHRTPLIYVKIYKESLVIVQQALVRQGWLTLDGG
ncbi:MAG: hypothetical protein AB1589_20180 [Cyanobacteriota bacterium]